MKPMLYVAGPYTKPNPITNMRRAILMGTQLLDSGLFAPIVPHLTGTWDMVSPRPYETWLEYDLEIIARCDGLFRMGGASDGADREVDHARSLGIAVFMPTESDALFAWARQWIAERDPAAAVSR